MTKTRHKIAIIAAFLPFVVSVGFISFASAAEIPDLPSESIPDSATISIKKLEQPDKFGEPATGLPQDIGGTPIAGVTFTATRVPGIDLTQPSGWKDLDRITVSDAIVATSSTVPADTATTDVQGLTQLGPLPTGLYLIQETSAPSGVLPSDPFLVAAPLPVDGAWVTNVHVYPKNAVASIDLRVIDQDTITSEDPVFWESHSTIPRVSDLDLYVVTNLLDPLLDLVGDLSEVRVQLVQDSGGGGQGTAPVLGSDDYVVSLQEAEGQPVIQVEFTQAGLAKLERARSQSSDATVIVGYRTSVRALGAGSDGVYSNRSYMRAGSRVTLGDVTTAEDAETTKFGPLQILAQDRDHAQTHVPGTVFQLFATKADAAALSNPIKIGGVSEWVTGADGTVTIPGLRFSNYVNGLDRDPTSPLFRNYYAVMTHVPEGWNGTATVMVGSVRAIDPPVLLIQELWRPDNSGNGGLPSTGANVAGAIVLGAGLLCMGLFLRTRRQEAESKG